MCRRSFLIGVRSRGKTTIGPTKQRISQKQLAEELGVSQSLVSFVLNGRREGISPESFQRIWRHALEKGYRPKGMKIDKAPVHLPSGSAVGIIFRSGIGLTTQLNFWGHVHSGLHGALQKRLVSTMFLGSEEALDIPEFVDSFNPHRPLVGLAVFGQVEPAFLQAMKQLHPHIVTISATYPGTSYSVVANEQQALDLTVEHLWDLGHTHFAWIGGNLDKQNHQNRFSALKTALRLKGASLAPEDTVLMRHAERLDGYNAAKRLVESGRRKGDVPTAWVAHNGSMARGATVYLLEKGIRMPQDVSLVAVDMTRICEETPPLITSAFASPEEMGRKAAEILLHRADEDEWTFSTLVLPSSLAVRKTTGRPGRRPLSPGGANKVKQVKQ